jgi:hypothetical protein
VVGGDHLDADPCPPPLKSSAAIRAATAEPTPLVSWNTPVVSFSTPIRTTPSEICAWGWARAGPSPSAIAAMARAASCWT